MRRRFKDIDEYIAASPADLRGRLRKIRRTIHEAAPGAVETISYAMPAFKLRGTLVYFAVFENHIGFYPTSSGIDAFEKDLSRYKTSTGAVQFPLDEPIPFDLVRRIVEFRVKEDSSPKKKAAKKE